MEKLIDTSALEGGKFHDIESWTPVEASSWQRGWNDAIDAIISNVSTVDAPEVVRCKDCRWFENDGYHTNCQIMRFCVEAEDYCSRGERRENENL